MQPTILLDMRIVWKLCWHKAVPDLSAKLALYKDKNKTFIKYEHQVIVHLINQCRTLLFDEFINIDTRTLKHIAKIISQTFSEALKTFSRDQKDSIIFLKLCSLKCFLSFQIDSFRRRNFCSSSQTFSLINKLLQFFSKD
jgi:hypothetical protein